jgi:hypothetical protein
MGFGPPRFFCAGINTKGRCMPRFAAISPAQEEDLYFGMWSQRVSSADLQTAMSLDQAGFWARAQLAYEKALAKLKNSTSLCRHSELHAVFYVFIVTLWVQF